MTETQKYGKAGDAKPLKEFLQERNQEGFEYNLVIEHQPLFRYSLFIALSICYEPF